MLRRAAKLLPLVSLLAFVALVALWARSYYAADVVAVAPADSDRARTLWFALSDRGLMVLSRTSGMNPYGRGARRFQWGTEAPGSRIKGSVTWHSFSISHERRSATAPWDSYTMLFPHAAPTAVAAVLPIAWVLGRWQRARTSRSNRGFAIAGGEPTTGPTA